VKHVALQPRIGNSDEVFTPMNVDFAAWFMDNSRGDGSTAYAYNYAKPVISASSFFRGDHFWLDPIAFVVASSYFVPSMNVLTDWPYWAGFDVIAFTAPFYKLGINRGVWNRKADGKIGEKVWIMFGCDYNDEYGVGQHTDDFAVVVEQESGTYGMTGGWVYEAGGSSGHDFSEWDLVLALAWFSDVFRVMPNDMDGSLTGRELTQRLSGLNKQTFTPCYVGVLPSCRAIDGTPASESHFDGHCYKGSGGQIAMGAGGCGNAPPRYQSVSSMNKVMDKADIIPDAFKADFRAKMAEDKAKNTAAQQAITRRMDSAYQAWGFPSA